MDLITDNDLVNWVVEKKGVLFTRYYSNLNSIQIENCPENTLVCLTGYDNVLEYFFQHLINKFKYPILLILIETDFYQLPKDYLEHSNIKSIYAWNIPYLHPKLNVIPIGLNFYRQKHILTDFLEKHPMVKKTKLLGVNFSQDTNPIRKLLLDKVNKEWKTFSTFMKTFPSPKQYYRPSNVDGQISITETNQDYYLEIAQFKFILSPPGAGIDCHRTWEALYLDSIPIVHSSTINKLYEELPVLVIENWDHIDNEFLLKKYQEITQKKREGVYNLNKLTLDYWKNLILKY